MGISLSTPDLFERFLEEAWRKLPLTDADSKKFLKAEQTISNCRMTARRKIERWREEMKEL